MLWGQRSLLTVFHQTASINHAIISLFLEQMVGALSNGGIWLASICMCDDTRRKNLTRRIEWRLTAHDLEKFPFFI
jgi:hypothetical protein